LQLSIFNSGGFYYPSSKAFDLELGDILAEIINQGKIKRV